MVYSLKEGKCLAIIGERCRFSFYEDYSDYDLQERWYENIDCIPNAECGPSGVCHCLPGFYEDANATSCHPVKLRGTPCVNNFECKEDELQACINSSCQCDPKTSIDSAVTSKLFSGGLGGCQGKVGSTCPSNRDHWYKYCIPDALCDHDDTTGNMICTCKYPLQPTSDGQCGLAYGKSCLNERKTCIDSLVCLSFAQSGGYARSSCSCPDESYQRFDSTTHTCRSIVGAPCNPKLETSCTPMAKCIENQNSGMFLCECDDGHVETSRGTCQKAHGQTCSFGPGNYEICDEKAELVCLKGSCSCNDASNLYENGRRQCSRPVGVTCTKTSQCVANAFCDKFQGEGLSGRCKCIKDYHNVSKNRECVLDTDLTKDFVEGNSATIKVP
jgi:hypothetical protein